MASYRHLAKAPITEALIDLRVPLPPDSHQKLKGLTERIRDRFPNQKEMFHGELTFRFGPGQEPGQFKGAAVGYISGTQDETKKVQFRSDGFTFNKLKPYEDWSRMRDEAMDLWNVYSEGMPSGVMINRVALRYINHLEIPLGVELKDYLTTSPSIPDKLPQHIVEYLDRVVIAHPDLESIAIVTQNLQRPQPGAETGRLLLDIDIVKEQEGMKPETAWALLEKFRNLKNTIFFESITERTAELYK